MKRIKYLLLSLVVLTGCVDSLEDYNIDKKRASTVTPETLYTNALKSLSDILTTPNVNNNNYRLYIQYWSTTQYLDEPRYILNVRLIPQTFWDALYRNVLSNLNEAKRLLNEDQLMNADLKNNRLAQVGILEVFAWSALVNTFGNVPYTDALDTDKPLPKYDDAETIYLDLMDRLDAALALLNTNAAGFGSGELLYASKGAADRIPAWSKFANSLKLKLAMNLADKASTQARANTAITQAAANVFTSNADNARFPYIATPPNNNPVSENLNPTRTSRKDFVGAKPFVDKLNAFNDPRLPFFFAPAVNSGNFVGGYYGYRNNPVKDYSQISTKVMSTDFEALFLDYSEIEFLLAEAKERGILPGGAAEAEGHYNAAIRASVLYWGGTNEQATTYLAQTGVAYATATGDYKQKIGEQKIPVRLIYPINEQTLNGTNRGSAAAAIGGDAATTKLFWDID